MDELPGMPAPYRMIHFVLLVVLYTVPAWLALSPVALRDPDIWWHLRSAQWILAHHAVPRLDPFSAHGAGKPWAAYTWPFELLIYVLYQHFGLAGIAAYSAGMALAITAAANTLVRGTVPDVAAAVVLTLAGVCAISPILTPRPWLFSMLFFALELGIILDARRSGRWRRLLLLVPLFVLWANFHIQFLYGIAALALASIEPLLLRLLVLSENGEDQNRIPVSRWFAVLGACIAATLLTPYHLSLYRRILTYAQQQGVFNYVTEFYAPSFRHPGNYFLLGLALVAAYSLGRARTVRPFPVMLLAAAAVLAFRSQRDAWFLAITSVGFIGAHGAHAAAPRWRPGVLARISLAVVVLTMVFAAARLRGIDNTNLAREVAHFYPVEAANVIAARNYPGPLFNQFNWGGYLMWRLPELPVAIDGRTDVYGPDLIRHSIELWNGEPGWASDPELLRARLIVGESDAALCSLLRSDPRFELVYADEVASVFRPRSLVPASTAQ